MSKDKLIHTTTIPKFELQSTNRYEINSKTVDTIAKSITRLGRNVQPILVSADNVIIDGQHRFLAYKKVRLAGSNVSLYYIKTGYKYEDKKDEFRDILSVVNTEAKQWRIADWINFHAHGGNKNYIDLMQLWESEYPQFNLTSLAQLTHEKYLGGNVTHMVQSGQYKYDFNSEKQYLIEEISDLIAHKQFFSQRGFMSAILSMSTTSGFDAQRLFKKIKSHLGVIVPQSGQGAWEGYLCDLYNKNHRGERLKPRTKSY